jgi:23S rRNA (pseudouridine1915-N3)-methyltransferase
VRIDLIAVGTRMPEWVASGLEDYARRLPRECTLVLRPVEASLRGRALPAGRLRGAEAERLLAAVPAGSRVVALDERGDAWTTADLARHLERWLAGGTDVALLVGGAEGLDRACLERAHQVWSLGPLTLPHMLVRVIVAEQLYRAWSILAGHPYHRAEAATWARGAGRSDRSRRA